LPGRLALARRADFEGRAGPPDERISIGRGRCVETESIQYRARIISQLWRANDAHNGHLNTAEDAEFSWNVGTGLTLVSTQPPAPYHRPTGPEMTKVATRTPLTACRGRVG